MTLLVPLPHGESHVRLSGAAFDGPRIRFTLSVDGRREQVVIARRDVVVTTLRNVPPEHGRRGFYDGGCTEDES